MNTDYFKSKDGYKIYYHCFEPQTEPKFIMMIVHGMAEYPLRYQDLCLALAKMGGLVIAPAHRGHGQSGQTNGLMGHFSDESGYFKVLDDLHKLAGLYLAEYQNLPFLIFGHSFGSFLVRSYIKRWPEDLKAAVISGSTGPMPLIAKCFKPLIYLCNYINGPRQFSPWLNELTNRQNLKYFRKPRTKFDWLNRDGFAVDAYISDPDCGFYCSNAFFKDTMTALEDINDLPPANNIASSLPLLFISGGQDPVGAMGKGIKQNRRLYLQKGYQNIVIKLYPKARHELLHEFNKGQVLEDILNFVAKALRL